MARRSQKKYFIWPKEPHKNPKIWFYFIPKSSIFSLSCTRIIFLDASWIFVWLKWYCSWYVITYFAQGTCTYIIVNHLGILFMAIHITHSNTWYYSEYFLSWWEYQNFEGFKILRAWLGILESIISRFDINKYYTTLIKISECHLKRARLLISRL